MLCSSNKIPKAKGNEHVVVDVAKFAETCVVDVDSTV